MQHIRHVLFVVTCLSFLVSLAGSAVLGSSPDAELVRVGRWQLWEQSLRARVSYRNPFTDVSVTITLVSPSGKSVEREAFYDGESTWRIRYAPDTVGRWYWTSRSQPEDAGMAAHGTFECVESGVHGPLRVNEGNPLWFTHADGTPVYLLAFHIWRSDVLEASTLARTLDFAKDRGFNAILSPHLEASHMAWERTAEGKPDFTRLNLTVWRGLDRTLRLTAERRMVLIPFSIVGGTNRLPAPRDPASRDLLLRYWVARWGGFWNATYQPFSEWEEGYKEPEVVAIGQRLYELDGDQHLISVHSLSSSSEGVQRATWFSYHTIQDKLGERTGQNKKTEGNSDPEKYRRFAELYRRVPKPILAQECLWEGNYYQGESGLDVDLLRRGAWVIALSGGQINYADEVVSPRRPQRKEDMGGSLTFSDLGTDVRPGGELYPTLTHLAGLMRSLPFQRLTVRPELASTGICLAEAGRTYVVYTLAGGEVRVDLKQAPGEFIALWFDPRTGERTPRTPVDGGQECRLFAPDSNDWVLLLEKQSG
jgi:hypothetical protein